MIQPLSLDNATHLAQILQLQQASYRVEAELIGSYAIPPLHDTLDSLRHCGETFLGIFIDEELAGILSYQIVSDPSDSSTLDICRLAVFPHFFRRGLADQLLHHVLAIPCQRYIVSTGKANLPAIRCYQKHGFRLVGEEVKGGGIEIVHLEKVNPAH